MCAKLRVVLPTEVVKDFLTTQLNTDDTQRPTDIVAAAAYAIPLLAPKRVISFYSVVSVSLIIFTRINSSPLVRLPRLFH